MSTVHEIENAIRKLPDEDLVSLRAWFAEFDAVAWDRPFKQDVAEGRLADLSDEALRDARGVAQTCEPPRDPDILRLLPPPASRGSAVGGCL